MCCLSFIPHLWGDQPSSVSRVFNIPHLMDGRLLVIFCFVCLPLMRPIVCVRGSWANFPIPRNSSLWFVAAYRYSCWRSALFLLLYLYRLEQLCDSGSCHPPSLLSLSCAFCFGVILITSSTVVYPVAPCSFITFKASIRRVR